MLACKSTSCAIIICMFWDCVESLLYKSFIKGMWILNQSEHVSPNLTSPSSIWLGKFYLYLTLIIIHFIQTIYFTFFFLYHIEFNLCFQILLYTNVFLCIFHVFCVFYKIWTLYIVKLVIHVLVDLCWIQ